MENEKFENFKLENLKLEILVGKYRSMLESFQCSIKNFSDLDGYKDVGDKWMLVTLSWRQFLDVSDRISILMTSFGCWCPTLML